MNESNEEYSDGDEINNKEILATPMSYDKVPEAICKHSAATAFDYQFFIIAAIVKTLQTNGTSTRKKVLLSLSLDFHQLQIRCHSEKKVSGQCNKLF